MKFTQAIALPVRGVMIAAIAWLLLGQPAASEEMQEAAPPADRQELRLTEAAMCESIRAFKPVNSGSVFPVSVGKIYCFTAFEKIPEKMFIHHHWYRRDQLVTRRGLQLIPPKWSSASSIQIRDADKGPWRVDITDDNGRVLTTLRFSITD
ncbi:MAG: DUF2914 domain-containing protein [Desulfobacterales bacterium]